MKKLMLIAVVALVATTQAWGWGGVGHASIAYMAEQHLTPEAKEKCRHYLHHSLPYYASWMDRWRTCKGFEETCKSHSGYVDENYKSIPYDGRNGVYVILRAQRKLKNYHKLKDSLVADNLKYLIHLVGDVHCPSHTRYPSTKSTSYMVRRNGKKMKVHAFWDSSPSFFHKNWDCEQFCEHLDTWTPEQIAECCKLKPVDWIETNAHRVEKIYEYLPEGEEYNNLPDETKQKMVDLMDYQMRIAAYRLADVLNTIFSK